MILSTRHIIKLDQAQQFRDVNYPVRDFEVAVVEAAIGVPGTGSIAVFCARIAVISSIIVELNYPQQFRNGYTEISVYVC